MWSFAPIPLHLLQPRKLPCIRNFMLIKIMVNFKNACFNLFFTSISAYFRCLSCFLALEQTNCVLIGKLLKDIFELLMFFNALSFYLLKAFIVFARVSPEWLIAVNFFINETQFVKIVKPAIFSIDFGIKTVNYWLIFHKSNHFNYKM